MRTLAFLLAAIIAPPLVIAAAAQDVLAQARRHYEAAAYEDALSTLATADRTSRSQIVEVEQYRALCLIALGRIPDAESAIGALVAADPLYLPAASPKVQAFIAEVRRNALPGVARRLLESGRTAFADKNLDRARDHFQLLLRVLADPDMQARAESEDLRVLAEGFVALITATPASPPAHDSTESQTTAVPAPPSPQFEPAVAVREVFPPWEADRFATRREYVGTIKVLIGVDGRVKSASIQQPSHPAYDARLLDVVRSWVYKPATQDGDPVEFERLIAFRLRPRDSSQIDGKQ